MNYPPPVDTFEQVAQNARTYTDLIDNIDAVPPALRKTLVKTLTMSRGWFTFDDKGEALIVPAKFGGHASMTLPLYEKSRQHINGTVGEKAIKKSCSHKLVGVSHPAMKKLRAVIQALGGDGPSVKAVMYEITPQRRKALSREDQTFVESVMALSTYVSKDARTELARRLAA